MRCGERIAGRYKLVRFVASGGMGDVFLAVDETTGDDVALKVLPPHLLQRGIARFEREAVTLRDVAHDAVVGFREIGTAGDGRVFLAMDWLEGMTLRQRLDEGGPTFAETIALGIRVASGLFAAHERGIVHRDIKPENLFLVGKDATRTKIIDFGIARDRMLVPLTRTGAVLGTPSYMAPEQARGIRDLGPAADLFSLGAVLYECIAAEPPFTGASTLAVLAAVMLDPIKPLRERVPKVPEAIDALVSQMLAKDPSDRPASAAEVAERLSEALELAPHDPDARRRVAVTTRERSTAVGLALRSGGPRGAKGMPSVAALDLLAHHGAVSLGRDEDVSLHLFASDSAAPTVLASLATRVALELYRAGAITGASLVTDRAPSDDLDAQKVLAARAKDHLHADLAGVVVDAKTASLLRADYELEGLVVQRELRRRARTVLGQPSPFVGRAPELGALVTTYTASVAEDAVFIALVTAAAGMGKTRLREELVDALEALERPPTLCFASAEHVRSDSPFALLASCLTNVLRMSGDVGLDSLRARIRLRLGGLLPASEIEEIALAGADLLFASPTTMRIDPTMRSDRIRLSIFRFFEALSRSGPLALVLDDLHFADQPSIAFFEHLLASLNERPFVLFGFGRPEALERLKRLTSRRRMQHIRLGPMGKRAATDFVRRFLPSADDDRLDTMIARAEGNPLHLEELVRGESGGSHTQLDVPHALDAALEARIRRLDPDARRLLRAASVFGERFRLRGAATLASFDPGRARAMADDLVDQELVLRAKESPFANDEELAFAHALVREAAYGLLVDADRREAHALAGSWLEENGERDSMVLATHYDLGGFPARAVPHWLAAAESSLAATSLQLAAGRAALAFVHATSDDERTAAKRIGAEARRWQGTPAEAVVLGVEAIRFATPATRPWYDAVTEVLLGAQCTGDSARITETIETLLATHAARPVEEGELAALVRAVFASATIPRGEEIVARLQARIDETYAACPELDAWTDAWMSVRELERATMGHDIGERLRREKTARAKFAALGDVRRVLKHRVSLAASLRYIGDYEEALREAQEAEWHSRALDLLFLVRFAQLTMGMAQVRLGRAEEGFRTLQLVIADTDPADLYTWGPGICATAMCKLETDPNVDVDPILARLRDHAANAAWLSLRLDALDAHCAVRDGDAERALQLVPSTELALSRLEFDWIPFIEHTHVCALQLAGRTAESAALLSATLRRIEDVERTLRDPARAAMFRATHWVHKLIALSQNT